MGRLGETARVAAAASLTFRRRLQRLCSTTMCHCHPGFGSRFLRKAGRARWCEGLLPQKRLSSPEESETVEVFLFSDVISMSHIGNATLNNPILQALLPHQVLAEAEN